MLGWTYIKAILNTDSAIGGCFLPQKCYVIMLFFLQIWTDCLKPSKEIIKMPNISLVKGPLFHSQLASIMMYSLYTYYMCFTWLYGLPLERLHQSNGLIIFICQKAANANSMQSLLNKYKDSWSRCFQPIMSHCFQPWLFYLYWVKFLVHLNRDKQLQDKQKWARREVIFTYFKAHFWV